MTGSARHISITSRILGWLSLLALTASAQEIDQAVLLSLIQGAQHQILLVAPGLYHPELAQALHTAAVKRGVQLLLLLEAGQINAPSNYGAAFSLLAPERPVYVRVVRSVNLAPRLILDSRILVSGPLLAGDTLSALPTVQSRDMEVLRKEIERFNQVWSQAPPCRPKVYLLQEKLVLRCRY